MLVRHMYHIPNQPSRVMRFAIDPDCTVPAVRCSKHRKYQSFQNLQRCSRLVLPKYTIFIVIVKSVLQPILKLFAPIFFHLFPPFTEISWRGFEPR